MSTKELPFPKVQKSWARAMQIGAQDESKSFGLIFYDTLFTDFPFLKEQDFKGVSIAAQRVNLPKFITTALSILDDMPKAIEALQQLGFRHVLYGTKDAYYAVVGANVIKTLKKILSPEEMDAETEAEWLALYNVMQKTIIDASQQSNPRALPYWKKFWKKRGGEFAKIVEGVDCSSHTGIKADLATVSRTVQEQQSIAAIEALVGGMSQSQVDNLKANIIAAIEAKKGGKVNLSDQFIIEWFAGEFANAKAKGSSSSSSSSCCSMGNCVTIGAIAVAVGAAAWFFLKKQN